MVHEAWYRIRVPVRDESRMTIKIDWHERKLRRNKAGRPMENTRGRCQIYKTKNNDEDIFSKFVFVKYT